MQPNVKTDIEARVKDTGDIMTGALSFYNKENYFALDKIRTIEDIDYRLTLGVGATGTASLELYDMTNDPGNWASRLNLYKSKIEFIGGDPRTAYEILHTGNFSNLLGNDYISVYGDTMFGALKMYHSNGIQTRHIDGNIEEFSGDLYINYGTNAPVHIGYQGNYAFSADGSYYDGTSLYSIIPSGFSSRTTSAGWGTLGNSNNGYTQITSWNSGTGGSLIFAEKNGQIFMQIDGVFYQNEGAYLVLDSNNISNYAAPKSHTHPITQITWAGTQNLSTTGANTEWSIDMAGDATNSYFHIWSGIKSASCMQFENNTGICRAPFGVYGGVWNDYAEFRKTALALPGEVIAENGDGTLSITTERLQPGCVIVSDTFGFAIGQTDDCQTPIAVSGRVLAYPAEDRYSYKPGDAVCSAPNGRISKMTRREIIMYPERIIGTVSEIPEYERWGEGNVLVDGRIWISIR